MRSIGIFGGTFDPIHIGHLITAQAVREKRNLDKIIFIPTLISPHKTEIPTISPIHRLEMIKLSIKDIPYFDFSEIEIENQAISYTIDTLSSLRNKYDNIELIIGFDNILKFSTWKNPDDILKLSKLIVLRRKLSELPEVQDKYYKSAIFVDTPAIEISSSEVRDRIKNNLPIKFLVPAKVERYIYKHNLYKE